VSDVDKDTRRWRLRGYRSRKKDEKPCHDSVCRGDHELSQALSRLERDRTVVRIIVDPA
jgi:hypothetical protein